MTNESAIEHLPIIPNPSREEVLAVNIQWNTERLVKFRKYIEDLEALIEKQRTELTDLQTQKN